MREVEVVSVSGVLDEILGFEDDFVLGVCFDKLDLVLEFLLDVFDCVWTFVLI